MNIFNRVVDFFEDIIENMFHHKGHGISLLIPYKKHVDPRRDITLEWLKDYWKHELPGAELIVSSDGSTHDQSFCKTRAVNRAAGRAKGDIFVILDADCYISGDVLIQCAERIRDARKLDQPLWYVPYRHFYRLNQDTSLYILMSDPSDPLRVKSPPDENMIVISTSKNEISHGHGYGALIQLLPREAFEMVGGMDERFNGWGGEDVSFMRAVDTLYGHHKTTKNDVYHLWHPTIGKTWERRMWPGQKTPGNNNELSNRYVQAINDRAKMRALINENKPS